MKFLKKLQKLDIETRTIIMWLVVIALGIIFAVVWLKVSMWRLGQIDTQELKKEFPLPKIEIPTFTIPTLPAIIPSATSSTP